VFSARRERMSSLKFCFLFFPSFFLFKWFMQEIKLCVFLYAFISTVASCLSTHPFKYASR
jgi:hypothetical protein